jgi:hypothetical protein
LSALLCCWVIAADVRWPFSLLYMVWCGCVVCADYAADKAGIVILQDMVQHYGDGAVREGGLPAEARYYWSDLKEMIDGIGNHPSIIQVSTPQHSTPTAQHSTAHPQHSTAR